MQILLANPRGFCAGVDRAIAIVNEALRRFHPPIYVRHEVVHNKFVVEDLARRGAVFVEELNEVPDGAIVIFSAHGVSKAVEDEAMRRDLTVFDATCPLVTKVHIEVGKFAKSGMDAILIGHAGHPEVEGTMGRFDTNFGGRIHLVEDASDVENLNFGADKELAFVTQTTLSMDDTAQVINALKDKFPQINAPRKDDICYATQNRQDAVKSLAKECQIVLVVGSPNSSNSNRLRELAERLGAKAYLIDNAGQMDKAWFDGVDKVGVSAGASAPEVLIKEVLDTLQEWGADTPTELLGIEENVTFSLPKSLR
ncbi:4-hydroxy-3-methylbut-2-enyl diphosphate reductase [Moraxella nonliquefaciens]|jgi:4-hydroxy-3-methylbut-2-enyl diphosphate reductase|uniref:4-hydroxy-3-methylbut-2-enyl diphosphate reductase n=1 Tax=Moraxella nonliquefaciens TaxID=478 RepID=A0A1B8QMD6_MORNO|nr:4-hydroxy-3-methylbut-2-enyl diphosphate reductase [Moraxella nonliquefaciens]MCG7411285.1 4-hydroxy-3-methylbut-2-enyl diphosphate reductase [Moraxella nonliquefaciens]MDI4497694.1 4-hydroxy-3-methylbut-2-enyl diphosphate reductase [Moraxella nonliquefaciens]OBX50195.1 4-hydroxy-3-methylbut-2-enyl diphosphate reductase [Moraxella nonliquefaciens]OBX85032.1 4-hydroxy-3-methylbut-2-enyl diphosphate reductase [Moraxella nonliquefaciens]QPT45333.1 4-hydroxy-3-methylbut-2-enyl diphosphate reduc